MEDKRLRKLKRSELLEMLLEAERENEALAEENHKLRQRLNSRELSVEEAGNLAEAALKVSGVFEAAQRAADVYLENVKRRCNATLEANYIAAGVENGAADNMAGNIGDLTRDESEDDAIES